MSSLKPTSPQVLNNVEMGDPVSEKRVLAFGNSTVDILVGNAKSEDAEVKVIPIVLTSHVDDYPDGGLAAWSVVVGATCAIFATFGVVNTWGTFQTYYGRVLLSDTKTSTIAWIGSVQYALIFLPGLLAGRLCDLGYYKRTLFISSVILVVATAAIAECKEFWQLLLCQGFLTGISCGMIFGPIPIIISHWFKKRRSLAFGISATGSAIGGTVIPIASSHLVNIVGFKWTIRVIALITFCMLAIANLTLRRRLDPPKNPGPFFAWHDFRKPAFNVFVLAGAITFLGLYTLLTYIELSAIALGITPGFSFYLVSIANASSGFGRITSGFLGDKLGAINVSAPMTLVCAIMTYFWPLATTRGSLIAVAVIYGFCSGAYVTLLPVPLVAMGDMHDAGRRTGIAGSAIALGAVAGPPISGFIIQSPDGFKTVSYYAGSCIFVAVILLYVTKYLMLGTLRGKF
ncbi:MFS general substrate transporter [Thelephora terrestris]|uniref:MFS general substrate transporter n=1 Tax=Thelephora terrestris TaxID=56493 RepID=A0A9P6H885_9AGAM|nr:MFS general substrate transporter [Thelephora terrestris]